jgi:hypothetical protein
VGSSPSLQPSFHGDVSVKIGTQVTLPPDTPGPTVFVQFEPKAPESTTEYLCTQDGVAGTSPTTLLIQSNAMPQWPRQAPWFALPPLCRGPTMSSGCSTSQGGLRCGLPSRTIAWRSVNVQLPCQRANPPFLRESNCILNIPSETIGSALRAVRPVRAACTAAMFCKCTVDLMQAAGSPTGCSEGRKIDGRGQANRSLRRANAQTVCVPVCACVCLCVPVCACVCLCVG